MIAVRQALLADHVVAFNDIVVRYFQSTEAKEGVPPIDFNWDLYLAMEQQGALLFVATLDHGRLIGGVTYFVSAHPHHKTRIVGSCDTLAVDTAARGHGVGRRLVEAAEPLLIARGVSIVTHGFRHCYGAEPLFPKLGFMLNESIYLKQVSYIAISERPPLSA